MSSQVKSPKRVNTRSQQSIADTSLAKKYYAETQPSLPHNNILEGWAHPHDATETILRVECNTGK